MRLMIVAAVLVLSGCAPRTQDMKDAIAAFRADCATPMKVTVESWTYGGRLKIECEQKEMK